MIDAAVSSMGGYEAINTKITKIFFQAINEAHTWTEQARKRIHTMADLAPLPADAVSSEDGKDSDEDSSENFPDLPCPLERDRHTEVDKHSASSYAVSGLSSSSVQLEVFAQSASKERLSQD